MWFRSTVSFLSGLALLALLLQGCATTGMGPVENLLSPEQKIDELKISPVFEKGAPRRVAVLPFANVTGQAEASEIVRRGFYSHFASKRHRDVELYHIDAVLEKNGLYKNQGFMKMSPEKLGNLLGADGLVYGKVTGFDRLFLCAYSQVSVELEAKLVRVSTGETLWQGKHRTAHHEASIPFTPFGVVPALIRTAINVRDIELVRTTDDLCRTMVSAVPDLSTETARTVYKPAPAAELSAEKLEQPADKAVPQIKDPATIAMWKDEAHKQLREGRSGESVRTLLKILAEQKDDPDVHFLLGMAYHQDNNSDGAVRHMTRATELAPMNTGFHYNLGLARIERGNLEGAVAEWKRVMELDPDNKSAGVLLELYAGGKGD